MYKPIKITLMAYTLFACFLFANSDKIINSAWQHIGQNNFTEAKTLLKQAINNDGSPRAYLALSLIEQLLGHNENSWENYDKALNTLENPNPYIFAAALTNRAQALPYPTEDAGIFNTYEKILKGQSNPDGVLWAGTIEKMGRYYLITDDVDDAVEVFSQMGAIDQWTLIGPFENISASGFDKVFEPEKEYVAEKEYLAKNEIPVHWFKIAATRHDFWIDFKRYFAHSEAIFYGNTFVYSDKQQIAQIRVGTSGSLKVFLNDQNLYSNSEENNNDLDTYIIETELQKGWNRLLIKCGYSEISQCNFLVRVTTPDGRPIRSLKYDTNSHDYSKKATQPKIIRNFAEIYFEDAIEKNPDQIENYILLAESYLRNDKAPQAEKVLNIAAKKMPESVLIKTHLLEAYIRGEKYDEISTTRTAIYSLFPDIPFIVEFMYNDEMGKNNLDKAAEMAEKYNILLPNSDKAMMMEMAVNLQKGEVEKGLKILNEAYKKYPYSWDVVYLKALFSERTTKSHEEAIDIYSDFLDDFKTENAFIYLANAYLNSSKVNKYEEIFKKLLKTDPAATGIYFALSKVFLQIQNYSKAKQYIDNTLQLCPISSVYWAMYGDIYQASGNPNEAIHGYNMAIKYDPKNYKARERLRYLLGKPDIFKVFHTNNIDSLVTNAPGRESYEESNGVILLEDNKMVVYHNGASEKKSEILVKLFNAEGIDSFKEYWIPLNGYSEKLVVEKAVTIKKDGSEIEADIKESQLVFKSLEANDFIYAKWHIETYNRGRLSNHFWDEVYFNYYYPMENASYSLLIPEDISFQHKTQFMPDKPEKRVTEEGVIYRWQSKNEAGISTEYNMPGFNDVAKRLFISSIPSWEYLVDWYLDLAKTKSKGTYEVKDVVTEMFKEDSNASEIEKISKIYNYITENIAYSSVSFRQSALIPQQARKVLVQRIGDCKDVATLCIAMLKEVGINAHYVLVNTYDQGVNRNVLPSIAFNHAIVGAETSKGTLFMDLTAQSTPLHSLPYGDIDAFALEIKPGEKEPFYLKEELFKKGFISRKTEVNIKEDNSAEFNVESYKEGPLVGSFRNLYRNKGTKERITELSEVLADDFPNIKIENFRIDDLSKPLSAINYDYQFFVPQYMVDAGNMKLVKLPWSDDFKPLSSISYDERKYDLVVRFLKYSTEAEITMNLPKGYEPIEVTKDINYTSVIGDYSLKMEYKNGVITAKRSYVNKQSIVKPKDYKEFKDFYNKVVRADATQIILKPKN